MSDTYRLVYKKDQSLWMNLLLDGKPFRGWTRSEPVDPNTIHGALKAGAELLWPGLTVWRRLNGTRQVQVWTGYGKARRPVEKDSPVRHPILDVSLENGRYVVMRNGSNVSDGNYVIIDARNRKLRTAQVVPEALAWVMVMGSARAELPLILTRDLEREFGRKAVKMREILNMRVKEG